MPVSKRCLQHFENNCQEPYCVWDRKDADTNPGRIRPKPTYGAPETSWAHPYARFLEESQMTGVSWKHLQVAEKLPTPKQESQLLPVPSILIHNTSTPPRMDSLRAADINRSRPPARLSHPKTG